MPSSASPAGSTRGWPADTAAPSGPVDTGSATKLILSLETLRRDADGLLGDTTQADLAAARDRVEQARCNVVVLGAFKRGKSTLLNALLARDVLPTGILPLTSAATVLRGGDVERLTVHLAEGRTEEHPLTALAAFVTEPGNPGNELGVTLVEIELPHPLLASGLQLVDTPGIASIHRHNTRAAYDVLGRVDAAVCVISADQPLSEQEAELYRAASERAARVLYVLTKADLLSADECEQALRFVRDAIVTQGLGTQPEILPLSAIGGRGVGELRDRLLSLADEGREGIVTRAAARTARFVAGELARRCALEERALQLPLDELAVRAATLQDRLEELDAARADANDLAARRLSRLLSERVNAPLLEYARAHHHELQRALGDQAAALGDLPPRVLAERLDEWIDDIVRTAFSRLAVEMRTVVGRALAEVTAIHTRRIERLLDQVRQAAADALGVEAGAALPGIALAAPTGFTFKLHEPERGLGTVAHVRRRVPGALGRRMAISDARERLHAMTDRHAGRLRGELVTRAEEAMAEHRRLLDATMREACDAVRTAIERAREERSRGSEAARARLEDLTARHERAVASHWRLAELAES